MTRATALLGVFLLSLPASAATVYTFNHEVAEPQRIERQYKDETALTWAGCLGCLVDPDVSGMAGVPSQRWFHQGGVLIVASDAQLATWNALSSDVKNRKADAEKAESEFRDNVALQALLEEVLSELRDLGSTTTISQFRRRIMQRINEK